MRKIIIAIAALFLLGSGGAGAYFYFGQSAEASAGSEVGDNYEKNKEDKKGKKKKGGYGGSFEFVELSPLMLPIVDNNGVSQTVSLVVALEVADSGAADKVKKFIPRLTDAFIQDMYGVLNRHAAMKGGVIQVTYIKERLNKISAEVLGDDVVHDVLLQVVQQRPI